MLRNGFGNGFWQGAQVRPTAKLGQTGLPYGGGYGGFTWGGGTPSTSTPSGDLKCYKCGMNEPRMLYPSVADPNPLCVEVPETECGAPGTVPIPLPGTTPAPTVDHTVDVRMIIPSTLHLADDMTPVEGASMTVIRINPDGSEETIGTGVTDADGNYTFDKVLKIPLTYGGEANPISYLRVIARSTAATPSFPEVIGGYLRVWQELLPQHFNQQLVACPYGTNPIVCTVARAQAQWLQIMIHQGAHHAGALEAAISFATRMAHAAVRNMPGVGKYWVDIYSWWVGDFSIPPKDWPEIIERSDQAFVIFTSIPWPKWPGIEDLFWRCAKALPIGQGKDGTNYGVYDAKLYSSTFSDYFPRSSEDIERDMAIAYWQGLQPIFACMVHRIKAKERETKRAIRAMSLISFTTVLAFSPMLVAAGPAGLTVLGEEWIQYTAGGPELPSGVTVAMAAALLAAGDTDFIVQVLEPVIGSLTADMDPLAQEAIGYAYPQIIDSAVDAVLGPAGIGSGVNTVPDGYAVGSAAIAMTIKMIAGIAKNYAYNEAKDFGDVAAGANQAAADLMAMVEGDEVSPEFKPFLKWVVDTLDFVSLFEDAIDQFLDEFMEAWENGEAQGGSVTIVPEEDGGGLTAAPTNAAGVPTDADGNPLPGGEAPKTEPTIPTSPGTTVATVAGVGGATALVLALTGAFS